MKRLQLSIIAVLCALAPAAGHAGQGYEGLWSLYMYEQASHLCGFPLTEEQENDLDEAQHRARVELSLSPAQAAELYRRAGEKIASAKQLLCDDAQRSELGLASLQGGPG